MNHSMLIIHQGGNCLFNVPDKDGRIITNLMSMTILWLDGTLFNSFRCST